MASVQDSVQQAADHEPVSSVELIRLTVAALVTFGLPLNDGQQFALFALMSAAGSWWVRHRVFSPATVAKKYIPALGLRRPPEEP